MSYADDSWKLEGTCNQVDPELFFPSRGEEGEDEFGSVYNPVAAKKICASCPVKDECLEYALENNEQYGIWGGKSHIERREIHRARGTLRTSDGECAVA